MSCKKCRLTFINLGQRILKIIKLVRTGKPIALSKGWRVTREKLNDEAVAEPSPSEMSLTVSLSR